MKKILVLLVFALVTCTYTYDVYTLVGTQWVYEGDIIENDINAGITEMKFTDNTVVVFEEGIPIAKSGYEFNSFRRYIGLEGIGTVERLSFSKLKLKHNNKDYIFSLNI